VPDNEKEDSEVNIVQNLEGDIVQDSEVNIVQDLEGDIVKLYNERNELEEEIKKLDQEKIQKLEEQNEKLEKRVEWLDKERTKVLKEKNNLKRQVSHRRTREWSRTLIMISILGIVDLLVVPLLVTIMGIPVQWIFVALGIITFFGILLIVNYMSGSSPLDTGEIRKALTGSFVILYFVLVPLITFGGITVTQGEAVKTIITNFTWIVGAIIIFYFGSRAVEEYVKIKDDKK
jgi:hypothetical protein